jgi:trans-2-enoyl-CoA reductase
MARPGAAANALWPENSLPWSKVIVVIQSSGTALNARMAARFRVAAALSGMTFAANIVDLLYNTEDSYYTMMHGIR